MHESEAKAYFLRDMRKAKKKVADFYQYPHEFQSKKQIQTFLQAFRKAHDDILLFEYQKPTRHSWHYCNTFFYIEPTAFEEEGIGKLLMAQRSTLDSKKLIRQDLEELLKVDLAMGVTFHSHFFIRLIQRGNLSGLKPALELVAHSMALLLVADKFFAAQYHQGQDIHIVFPDKVFVVNNETDKKVMIFKTVLLVQYMTSHQQSYYREAIQQATRSNIGFVAGVLQDDKLQLLA